jgi:hypothetical protein
MSIGEHIPDALQNITGSISGGSIVFLNNYHTAGAIVPMLADIGIGPGVTGKLGLRGLASDASLVARTAAK